MISFRGLAGSQKGSRGIATPPPSPGSKSPSRLRGRALRTGRFGCEPFLRQFSSTGFPPEYYDFLNGNKRQEPDWAKRYPEQWQTACDETRQLTLGTDAATVFLDDRFQALREEFGNRIVLLGGPPCQSYSLVGRARNAGNAKYDASRDERQLLYREYVRALRELQPAIAVMENVKGVLSARHNGKPIFCHILKRLEDPGGEKRYRLCALGSPRGDGLWNDQLAPSDFLVRAEEYGIPQSRHRVFVVCVREDIALDVSADSSCGWRKRRRRSRSPT